MLGDVNVSRTIAPPSPAPATVTLVRRGLPLVALVGLTALAATVALAGAATAAEPRPAPPIAGITLDGKRLSLASLRGRPVVVNVWSSW